VLCLYFDDDTNQQTMPAIDGLIGMSIVKVSKNGEPKETTPIRIGHVASRDLLIKVNGGGELRLEGVPVYEYYNCYIILQDKYLRFLIDAFNFIRLNGLNTEGIFRREGNANRLKTIWVYECYDDY
jgi:hypothetical protein